MELAEIYFAGGCFWGVEAYFSLVHGVVRTQVGYANGEGEDPSYASVCSGDGGFAETVRIEYRPDRISLFDLLKLYFDIVDPTAVNRQGNDAGVQYRTGIYSLTEKQRQTAQAFLDTLQKDYKQPIMIENLPLRQFIQAETYHQKYLEKNPNGYCHINFEKIAAQKAAKAEKRD